jgi:TRAP-type C4-dicarboxylate transport system permease small subunit
VILRYAVGSSLRWASELPELLFPWLVVSGIVLAVQHGGHIAVVMLTHRLPPLARRVVLAFGGGVVVALYAILAWSAAQLMPVVADELSPMLQVPGSVTVGAVEGGFILVAILTLISTVRIVADVAAPVRDAGEEAHP